jgi:DNA modification methylase
MTNYSTISELPDHFQLKYHDQNKIISKKLAELKPYPNNARTHSNKQIKQIASSMDRFGFTNPVLIDENEMILAGHGRVEAAKLLGLMDVPCIRLSDMTEAEKSAYILADNKLAMNAGWDESILATELEYLVEQSDEIDLTLTGFSIAETDEILEIGGTDPGTESEEDDRIPEASDDEVTVTRAGDIWQMGAHRLVCGDARDSQVYKQLLSDNNGNTELAEMVFTDPPYNVKIDNNVCGSGKTQHSEFAMASGEMSKEAFIAFLKDTTSQLVGHSKHGSIHFICMDWRHIQELLEAGNASYSELKNLCVWVKDNGGMGSFYRSRHELVFVFKNGDASHINTFELGQHGRYRTNVWNYRGISSGGKAAREELALHPTVKPVAMVADAIKDCSSHAGIILDAFAGSGTIFIAAQKTGRRARAIEIDPKYCDTSIVRWQAFAKDDAILVETGETFDEVQLRRSLAVEQLSANDAENLFSDNCIAAETPSKTRIPWEGFPAIPQTKGIV